MQKHWTVAEAKARLSEVMRLAKQEGPQRIGTNGDYLLIATSDWEKTQKPLLGSWLVSHLGLELELELPSREDPLRPSPFEFE